MHTHFSERPSHVRLFELIETTSLRGRMERAIEALIAALDALDGDCEDEGAQCEDEGAQCDDEGSPDWGVADFDGLAEQTTGGDRYGACAI